MGDRTSEAIAAALADPLTCPTELNNAFVRQLARSGRVAALRLVLADPRVDPSAGRSAALLAAARKGHVECVRLLLAHPRVHTGARNDMALLHAAAQGHQEIIELLLAGRRPTVCHFRLCEALRVAASRGHARAVRVLLPAADQCMDARQLDALKPAWLGACPFHAVMQVLLEHLRALLASSSNYWHFASRVLSRAQRKACVHGYLRTVEVLLQEPCLRKDDDVRYAEGLHMAVCSGHYEVVRVMLASPALATVSHSRLGISLRYATMRGDVEIVRLLLADGRARPVESGAIRDAIQGAVGSDRSSVLQLLLAHNATDTKMFPADILSTAVARGLSDVVNQLLLDPRVHPGAADNAAVHSAATCGQVDIMDRLLRDPRVDAGAGDGRALIDAVRSGRGAVVARLLADPRVDAGARSNAALRVAASMACDVIVRLLLASTDPRVDPTAGGHAAVWLAGQSVFPGPDAPAQVSRVVSALLADPRVDPVLVVRDRPRVLSAQQACVMAGVIVAFRWRRRRAWIRAA
jgi:ankyrin repeat protein